MGEKADKLMRELEPTRSLLRQVGDMMGVEIEGAITMGNAPQYLKQFQSAFEMARTRPAAPASKSFDDVIDEEIERAGMAGVTAAGALVPRSDITTDFTEEANAQALDREALKRIAAMVGAENDTPTAIQVALERVMGAGGDVEVPKGDTLLEAIEHGHQQEHELRNKLRSASMLIQRIANALQIEIKAGDVEGEAILGAIQRFEVAKVMMRRRIVELRANKPPPHHPATVTADELEIQFVRMLSPGETDYWNKSKSSPGILPPHPFVFEVRDVGRLAACVALSADRTSSLAETMRFRDLQKLMDEICGSPLATGYLAVAMRETLDILARERAAQRKE